MEILPIKSDADYRRALGEIEALMGAEPETPEGDRLDILVTLVEAWEERHYPLDLPDAVDAIRYHMEQRGLSTADLESLLGGPVQVQKLLSRKLPLTLAMARRLHEELGIPAESLLRQPALVD